MHLGQVHTHSDHKNLHCYPHTHTHTHTHTHCHSHIVSDTDTHNYKLYSAYTWKFRRFIIKTNRVSHPVPAQALENPVQKAEPLRCLALTTRSGICNSDCALTILQLFLYAFFVLFTVLFLNVVVLFHDVFEFSSQRRILCVCVCVCVCVCAWDAWSNSSPIKVLQQFCWPIRLPYDHLHPSYSQQFAQ